MAFTELFYSLTKKAWDKSSITHPDLKKLEADLCRQKSRVYSFEKGNPDNSYHPLKIRDNLPNRF